MEALHHRNNSQTPTSPLAYPGGYEIPSLMALKAICAFLVIQLHLDSDYKPYAIPICRIAVPIFFMISGYFMLNSAGNIPVDKIKRSLIKMLKIALWANVLYMLYWGFHIIEKPQYIGLFTSPYNWRRLIIYGDTYCFSLWYIVCYIQALLLIWLLAKYRATTILYWFIPIGLIANLLLGTYGHLYTDTMFNGFYHRNVITIGLPCIAIGILIRKYQHRFKFSSASLILTSLILLVATYIECIYFTNPYYIAHGDILITTIPLSIAIFLSFLHFDSLGKCKYLNDIGKYHSLNVYIFHVLIIWILDNFIPMPFSFQITLLIYAIAIALSAIYLTIKKKIATH